MAQNLLAQAIDDHLQPDAIAPSAQNRGFERRRPGREP